jgi:uncharacterized protein (TIGR03435 family)
MRKVQYAGLVAFCFASMAPARALAANEFDVVSIKANNSASGVMSITPAVGGTWTAKNVSLGVLIAIAYDLRSYQISGLPKWGWSENYDVVAKAPGTPGRAEISSMLGTMLAERFQLRSHTETRPMSGYELVPDTGGPNLQNARDSDCPSSSSAPSNSVCGVVRISLSSVDTVNVDLDQLAAALGQQRDVGRPVVNRTGRDGFFNIHLKWSPTSASPDRAEPGLGDDSLSIFTALREQLGLRLKSESVQTQILVVDHAEKPSQH